MKALQAPSRSAGMTDAPTAGAAISKDGFERLLGELRPKLHRYSARMTGSVIDGEDVVQEALVKAIEALPSTEPIAQPEGWLFRIAHTRHWIFCDAAPDGTPSAPMRIPI